MDPESTGGGTCVCGVGGFDVACCCALCGGSNPESHRRMSVRAGVCVRTHAATRVRGLYTKRWRETSRRRMVGASHIVDALLL